MEFMGFYGQVERLRRSRLPEDHRRLTMSLNIPANVFSPVQQQLFPVGYPFGTDALWLSAFRHRRREVL